MLHALEITDKFAKLAAIIPNVAIPFNNPVRMRHLRHEASFEGRKEAANKKTEKKRQKKSGEADTKYVPCSVLPRTDRKSCHLSCDPNASFIQQAYGVLVSLTFLAQELIFRDLNVVEV